MTPSWFILFLISPDLLWVADNRCRLILLSLPVTAAIRFLKTILEHALLYHLVVKVTHEVLVVLDVRLKLPLHELLLLTLTKRSQRFVAASQRILNIDASRRRLTLQSWLGLASSELIDTWFYSVTQIGVVRKALLQSAFYDYTVLLEDLVPSAAALCLTGLVGLEAVSTSCRVGILFGFILEGELADVQARALASPLVSLAFAYALAAVGSAESARSKERGPAEAG